MKIVDINNCQSCTSSNTVIGIYYPNGVFHENEVTRGYSYFLDHLLYNNLEENFTGAGRGNIKVFTFYGYSCILIICTPDKAIESLRLLETTLSNKLRLPDYLDVWVNHWKYISFSKTTPFSNLYYAKRSPGSPLARTLSSAISCIPPTDQLQDWQSTYLSADKLICYISGANPTGIGQHTPVHSQSCLPLLPAEKLELQHHLPYKRLNLSLSIPVQLTSADILAAEACCEILKPKLAIISNNLGAQFHSAQFYPDIIPEWRTQVQVSKKHVFELVDKFSNIISLDNQLTPNALLNARQKVYRYYQQISNDSISLNRFAGYNTISGSRYNLAELCNPWMYTHEITQESISNILSKLQSISTASFFAASAY